MILGALGALGQSDIRRMLGYVVISGIGIMLAGLSLGSPGGIGGAIFYALHSMVVMTALYMAAGLAGRLAGSFDLNRLGGLYGRSALFSTLSLVLFFAVSGLPPFSGFWPKVMVAKAAMDIGAWWLTATVFLTGFLTTIALGRVFALAYWRPAAAPLPEEAIPASALLPLAGLTALTVVFGLFPDSLLSLSQHAAQGLSDPRAYIGSVFQGGN
jgi:multicomponent Na+:H+ antiporter subunit D